MDDFSNRLCDVVRDAIYNYPDSHNWNVGDINPISIEGKDAVCFSMENKFGELVQVYVVYNQLWDSFTIIEYNFCSGATRRIGNAYTQNLCSVINNMIYG